MVSSCRGVPTAAMGETKFTTDPLPARPREAEDAVIEVNETRSHSWFSKLAECCLQQTKNDSRTHTVGVQLAMLRSTVHDVRALAVYQET